jgi:hypothetical protein
MVPIFSTVPDGFFGGKVQMHESANWLGNLTFNQGNVGSNPISCTKLFRFTLI